MELAHGVAEELQFLVCLQLLLGGQGGLLASEGVLVIGERLLGLHLIIIILKIK